jgi:hypothetical protein
MGINDIYITPSYVLIFLFWLAFYVAKKKKNKLVRKYLFWAGLVRVIGAICVGLIYEFYYKGGDTKYYFIDSLVIYNNFFDAPLTNLQVFFISAGDYVSSISHITNQIFFFRDQSTFFVVKVVAFFNFLTFGTYTSTALFFALISLTGAWKLFTSLAAMYPNQTKNLAIATLFLPSVFFWGAGILKDTLTLSALSWFFYATYKIFIVRKNIIRSIIILLITFYVIVAVKIYIIMCFVPAVVMFLFLVFNNNIKNKSLRSFLKPMLLVSSIIIGTIGIGKIVENDQKYSFDKIVETSKVTASWIELVSKETGGSNYNIGKLEFDSSLLILFPNAVIVTLFRPFLWEIKSVVMLLAALEGLFLLYITFSCIKKQGLGRCIKIVNREPFLFFAFIFSFSFAFAVGISTNNFGTLVRYKIPLLPFYTSAIYILRGINYEEFMRKKLSNEKSKKSINRLPIS